MKALPPQFDASSDVVEQHEATSKDGTQIPYFIVHPKNMKLDGNNPTVINAYGGFGISMTPFYSGIIGKLWMERGGVFVLANIRGGGEFGPAWHDAGLKTNRQRVYDDFYAVAQDLVTRKVTSPRRLGISAVRTAAFDGRRVHAASGDVERSRHPGSAARHAALREARSRRFVGWRVRQRFRSGCARILGKDVAIPKS